MLAEPFDIIDLMSAAKPYMQPFVDINRDIAKDCREEASGYRIMRSAIPLGLLAINVAFELTGKSYPGSRADLNEVHMGSIILAGAGAALMERGRRKFTRAATRADKLADEIEADFIE